MNDAAAMMDEDNSPYCIDVADQFAKLAVDLPAVQRVIERTLQMSGCRRADIDVTLVGDAHIRELNESYLQHAGPTDCITFDLSDGGSDSVEGQIVISCETAVREAAVRGHDAVSEVLLYAVHGTLHLLGWDDDTPAEAERMHEFEDKVLSECGVGSVYHPPAP